MKIREKILPVLKRYDVIRAAIFGSFAREVVEFGAEKSLLDLAGLKIELEESLGRDVDVLT